MALSLTISTLTPSSSPKSQLCNKHFFVKQLTLLKNTLHVIKFTYFKTLLNLISVQTHATNTVNQDIMCAFGFSCFPI